MNKWVIITIITVSLIAIGLALFFILRKHGGGSSGGGGDGNQCPNNCNGNGICVNGKCQCADGYSGDACQNHTVSTCPNNCNGRGICVDEKCQCALGYSGDGCEKHDTAICKGNCSGNGLCVNGECKCSPGYSGDYCQLPSVGNCTNNCSGNGLCDINTNKCVCSPGYSGDGCEIPPGQGCPDNCNGYGYCEGGKCVCINGYSGNACQTIGVKCPDNCNGHGICQNGQCECTGGYSGNACQTPPTACPNNCNGNGKCENGKCQCNQGWEGDACDIINGSQFPFDGTRKWYIRSITNFCNSGDPVYMTVNPSEPNDGVTQMATVGAGPYFNNREWNIVPAKTKKGYYALKNVATGLCLVYSERVAVPMLQQIDLPTDNPQYLFTFSWKNKNMFTMLDTFGRPMSTTQPNCYNPGNMCIPAGQCCWVPAILWTDMSSYCGNLSYPVTYDLFLEEVK